MTPSEQSRPVIEGRELQRAARTPVTPRGVAGIVFFVALLAVFGRSLYDLAVYAMGTTLHSHVVLIPLISGYLIAIDRSRMPARGNPSFAFAGVLAAIGFLSWFIVHRTGAAWSENDRLAGVTFAFLCLLWAGGFIFLGREWMWAAAFPAAFLIFLVPLPDAVANALETASKYASAEAAAFLIGVSGTPMLRDGLIFHLPGMGLEVAQECSGIRSSWVLFITSLLASHLFLRSPWRRAALVLFVIPLGVIRNGFRIAVLAWLCVYYSPDMIDSVIHHRGGPLFFVLSLGPLFALLWWLRRRDARASAAEARANSSRA